MRVFVASLATETNTFAPLYVDRRAFEEAFYCPPGAHPDTPTLCSGPMVAARQRAKTDGFTLIEGTATWAEPAGPVSREAYESLRDEILGQLKAAMPVDVVLFGLHGSMVAVGYDDCEGDLMAGAREIAGPKAIIGAELDMHCHLSEQMVRAGNMIIAFKEFPHTDFLARAEDLVDLCLKAAKGEIDPKPALYDLRRFASFMSSREPGRSFVDRMLAMEGKDGILSMTIAHGFGAADVYDLGSKVLVYADGDANLPKARALAQKLGDELLTWDKETASPYHYPPEEAIAYARAQPRGPIVMADRWDNPGGGVAGDSTVMVSALLAHPDIPAAIGAMWDPIAVSFCRAAGVGSEISLRFGGKAASTSGPPIDATVKVLGITDNLLYPFEQSVVSLGPAAAISIGNLDIVLSTGRAQTFSPPVFTNLGVDLTKKRIVVVKSSNHFYAAFAPIAAEVIYLNTGGPFPYDITMKTFDKVRRPFYPLDPQAAPELVI